MDTQYSVLLYSKYSSNCKRLIDMMKRTNINFNEILKLKLLCIDNNEIRERITQDTKIDITIVPCILYVYSNGGIEKYDGSYVFDLINNIISQLMPKIEQQYQPMIEEKQVYQSEKQTENFDDKLDDLLNIQEDDRYKTTPIIPRVKQNNNEYIEDSEAFRSEPLNMRESITNAINNNPQGNGDVHGTMSKMAKMMQERENIEQSTSNQNQRPQDIRRP